MSLEIKGTRDNASLQLETNAKAWSKQSNHNFKECLEKWQAAFCVINIG